MTESEAVKLDERIGRLEQTVALGFFEQGREISGLKGQIDGLEGRMDRLEVRMTALEEKFDILADTVLDATKTILERIDGMSQQMERSTKAIRRRHGADRRLTRLVLADHNIRLKQLESGRQAQAQRDFRDAGMGHLTRPSRSAILTTNSAWVAPAPKSGVPSVCCKGNTIQKRS